MTRLPPKPPSRDDFPNVTGNEAEVRTEVRPAEPQRTHVAAPVARARLAYLDRLKVLLIAAIIAGHGMAGYSDLESAWPYQDIQEARLSGPGEIALGTVGLPAVLSVMGLFFFIAGLLTPGSLARKGTRRFVRDRVLRLGVPLVLWVLLLWPALLSSAFAIAGEARWYWGDPFLDPGPMWFVEVLLVYSLAYAAWSRWHQASTRQAAAVPTGPPRRSPLRGRTVVAIALAVSLSTCVVRVAFPLASGGIGQAHLWQWPQFVALFGLGVVAAERGWLRPVPAALQRVCGIAAACGLLATVIVVGAVVSAGLDADVFTRSLHWAPFALSLIEGPLAVGTSVWLLAFAQRHLDGPFGRFGRALARGSYAAFILQAPVLIALAMALRATGAPAELKALVVAAVGVAASFSLAWLLVTHTRLGRLL